MSTAGRSTWDMFSNSAAGRFTTAVTPPGTKEWQKNCGPSEQMSRSVPLTDGHRNDAFRAIYSDAKRPVGKDMDAKLVIPFRNIRIQ